MQNTQHELIWNDKTYTLRKMNPLLKAKYLEVYIQFKNEEIKNPHAELTDIVTSVAILKAGAPLIWEFLTPSDKNQIGTFDNFIDDLNELELGKFFLWATKEVEKTKDFLEQEQMKVGNG
ncbi:MAG: hypothetical protein AAGI66_07295 [Cyanobacteria bacterium P01_H01_bin.74]